MSGTTEAVALDHTCLAVTDIDAAVGFYGAAFGYEVTWQERNWTELIQRYVGVPGIRADLVQMRARNSQHTLEFIAFHDVPEPQEFHGPTRPGMGHLCFRVPDLEAAIRAVEELGAELVGEVTTYTDGGRGCYVREPAGTIFELDEAPLNS
jgi:catechol 2,3-dioxygenase-like lactoylglutathione lyase family enzyme